MCLLPIFSPVCGLSSPFLEIIIQRAEVLNLDEVQLVYYIFYKHTFGVASKKSSSHPGSSRFSSVLCSWNFTILIFNFRSLIHFESIFVKSLRWESWFFFFFAYRCLVWPASSSEKIIFAPLYCPCSFIEDQLILLMLVHCSFSFSILEGFFLCMLYIRDYFFSCVFIFVFEL